MGKILCTVQINIHNIFLGSGGGPFGGGGPVPWHMWHMPKSGPAATIGIELSAFRTYTLG